MNQGIATVAVWSSFFMWPFLVRRTEGPIGVILSFHLLVASVVTGWVWR